MVFSICKVQFWSEDLVIFDFIHEDLALDRLIVFRFRFPSEFDEVQFARAQTVAAFVIIEIGDFSALVTFISLPIFFFRAGKYFCQGSNVKAAFAAPHTIELDKVNRGVFEFADN